VTKAELDFVREHGALWQELEAETKYFRGHMGRIRNRVSKNGPDKERVDHYMEIYRCTANHLAYARSFFGESTETAEYLNRIAGNAHAVIYAGRSRGIKRFFKFIATGFPKLFRSEIVLFIISALALILPGLVAYLYVKADVRNALLFVDAKTLENLRPEGVYDDVVPVMNNINGFYIGENNIIVCLSAFAGGLTLGLFTLYMLINNGMLIGVLAAYFEMQGSAVFFWSLILPHGITEFFAIFLSGMAGFVLGRAIIRPGRISRKTALIKAGKTALKLIMMCILFLIFSAVVESWFTPLALPYWVKYAFSGTVLVLLVLYLCVGIRKRKDKSLNPQL